MKAIYHISNVPENGVIATREGSLLRLLFDFVKAEQPAGEDVPPAPANLYNCESVDLQGGSYGDIVSAIVNDRYSSDQIQAIMANYANVQDTSLPQPLSDEKKEEYLAEYREFQAWRAKAKEIAGKVLNG